MQTWLALALLLSFAICKAEVPPGWSANTAQAYTQTWQYNFGAAELALAKEKKPGLASAYVADTKWFLELFATENPARYNTYKQGRESTLDQIEAGSKNLPFYFFAKGEYYLHAAILHLKFGEYSSAAWEVNKAYKILKEGNSKHPDFLLLKRDLYLLQALVGVVPENYQWMLKILGFEGELKPSMAKYAEVANAIKNHPQYHIFLPETRIIQAFLTHHLLNNHDAAWKIIDEATKDFATNPVSAFARANLSLHQKKNEELLQTLSAYKTNLPAVPHLDYYHGLAKLQRGDADAGHYLARYLKHFKGHNYIKDAYVKLGWAFLLNGDTKNYRNSMELATKYGKAVLEEDKNALRDAKRKELPNIAILRARLLFDGGYYQQALSHLKNTDPANLSLTEQAEYYYRTGRIQESLQLYNEALQNYGTVIEKFSSLAEYFAPAACLFSGNIYEKQKNPEKARYFYRKCQQYKNYVYKDSFDQKALAGLKRLN